MIISEVIDAIDNIDNITMESEINTCNSLLSSYDKMSLLMENYNGDDLDIFNIFQEGFIDDVKNETKKMGSKQSTIMKILTLIPRIVIAAIKVIGKKLKGSKPIKDVEKSLSKDDKAKDFFDTVINKSAKVDHKHRKKYIAGAILGIAGTATLLGAKHIKEHGIGPFEALKRFSNSIHDKKIRSEVEKIIEKIDKVPEVSKFLEEKKR